MSTARVDFTRGAAERIARVVRLVEGGNRDEAGLSFGRGIEPPKSVLVRNDSGGTVAKHGVLGISGAFNSLQNHFTGVSPSIPAHRGKFVITLSETPNSEVRRACVHGVCVAKIDVLDPEHQFAEAVDGDTTQLQSATDGSARILCAAEGEDLYYVRLGDEGPQTRLAEFAGTWDKGETKEVFLCDQYGVRVAPEEKFEVLNLVVDVFTPNTDSFGKLKASRIGDTWTLDWFECEVEEVEGS